MSFIRDFLSGSLPSQNPTMRQNESAPVSAEPAAVPLDPKRRRARILLFTGLGCGGLVLLAVIAAIIGFIALLSSRPAATPQAETRAPSAADQIQSVVTQHGIVAARLQAESSSGVPFNVALAHLVSNLHDIDISQCPADFREAWVRYTSAFDRLKSEADSLPQSQSDALLSGMVNALGGEADGGYSRMKRGYDARADAVQQAMGELQAVAARYNVRIQ